MRQVRPETELDLMIFSAATTLERTVNMEEWQECQKFVSFSSWSAFPAEVARLTCLAHQDIGHNVAMCEHNALGMSSSARRVHQECKIIGRVHLHPAIPRRARCVADACEVLCHVRRIAAVSNDNHTVLRNPNLLGCFPSNFYVWHLRNERFGSRVLELESQLVDGVAWVRRGDDTTRPLAAPNHCWSIDAIGRVQCENIASLPVPKSPQAFAEFDRGVLDLAIIIAALGIGIEVDDCFL